MQWLYQKEATGSSRADIALTAQTTPCHGGQYRVHQGNMRNFGPTNTHGTGVCTNAMVISKGSYGHGEFKNVLP